MSLSKNYAIFAVFFAFLVHPLGWYYELSWGLPSLRLTALMGLTVLIPALMMIPRPYRWHWLDVIFGIIFIKVLAQLIWYSLEGRNWIDVDGNSFNGFVIDFLVHALVFFLLGKHLLSAAINTEKADRVLLVGFLIFSMMLVVNSNISSWSLDLSRMESSRRGIYLNIADCFVIYSIIFIASLCKERHRIVTFIVAIAITSLLYSRSAVLLFLFSGIISFVVIGGNRYQISGRALLTLYVASGLISLILLYDIQSSNSENRIFSFLNNGLEDASYLFRIEQLIVGIKDITENPINGSWGGHIDALGRNGTYIHNVLSYWRQFGFVVFMLCIAAFFLHPMLKIMDSKNNYSRSVDRLTVFLTCYCTFKVLLTNSFEWPYIWLLVGLISANQITSKPSRQV